jgi:hypothetical protein
MKRIAPFAFGAAIAVAALSPGTARAYTLSLGPNLDPPKVPVISNSVTCARQSVPAQIENAPEYDVPHITQGQGVSGASVVKVQLDANNALQNSALAESSGNLLLDQVAMNESQQITYASEVRNCQRVTGTYLLTVAFGDL